MTKGRGNIFDKCFGSSFQFHLEAIELFFSTIVSITGLFIYEEYKKQLTLFHPR
jgi:hypothetical protein